MSRLIVYWNPDQNPEKDQPVSYTLDGTAINHPAFLRYDRSAAYGDVYEIRDQRGVVIGLAQGATVEE